tara:strand:- start:3070 stop:3693 length:624 start_codon:yes stop_codon:yes gene_type:complete
MKNNHYTKLEIDKFEKVWNINFINSITGFKPANLIGTRSSNSLDNVAIFSSVLHLGSNPPLLGFTLRPQEKRFTDTYKNILDNSYYTINSIGKNFINKSHNTSKKYSKNISEFEKLSIDKFELDGFNAPFVKDSQIKLGLKKVDEYLLLNKCILIVGILEHIIIDNNIIESDGNINFDKSDIVCISGINSYLRPKLVKKLKYIKSSY